MKLITSAQNEQLKHLSKLLTQSKARREYGQTVLEGVHLLQVYLEVGYTPKQVYLPESKNTHPEIRDLISSLDEDVITWVGNEALSKITSLNDADDVMTWIEIPPQGDLPLSGDCVVLDRLQDPSGRFYAARQLRASGRLCWVMTASIFGRPKYCVRVWGRIFCWTYTAAFFYRIGWMLIRTKYGRPLWTGAILPTCINWI